MDFKRTQGLKKDSDFRKVYKHGKSFANRNLVMYILDNKSDSTRVGISVSKKVGNAINRNKIRRRPKKTKKIISGRPITKMLNIASVDNIIMCSKMLLMCEVERLCSHSLMLREINSLLDSSK